MNKIKVLQLLEEDMGEDFSPEFKTMIHVLHTNIYYVIESVKENMEREK